jgi:hypothetical protein
MVKPGALVMGVVMGAVSAATYYGLELLPPGTIPPPIGRIVVADTAAPAQAAPAPVVAAAPVEPAAAPAAAPEAEVTEQDLAEEPPPPEAAPVQDEPASAAAAPASAPAPVEKPAPTLAAKPVATEPAPAPAEPPAAVPAPAPVRKAEADPIKPWWPDPATLPDTQLKLVSATQVKGQPAIALLFATPISLESLKAQARVATSAGTMAAGEWEIGKTPRLAVFKSVDPGRYTVILRPQLADAEGRTLGTLLRGPVDIKGP